MIIKRLLIIDNSTFLNHKDLIASAVELMTIIRNIADMMTRLNFSNYNVILMLISSNEESFSLLRMASFKGI